MGAGNIGGNCARRLAAAGHEVMVSFSRDPAALERLADDIGGGTRAGTPADAVLFADLVVFSVPWSAVDTALAQAGGLKGRIVVDITNRFSRVPGAIHTETAARSNQRRMPEGRYTKSFNTLTAGFQAEVADRAPAERVVQWVAGDDADAKAVVIRLLDECGYVGVDLGGIDECGPMESPRRAGALYGEEYRLPEAMAAVAALRSGEPLPPIPHYV